MSTPVILTAAVEGAVDEVLLRRVCNHLGTNVGSVYGLRGKAYILSRLPGFNNSARFRHWVVLVDLDQDGACAAEVLTRWLPIPAALMSLRIAIRELEAWLLGDPERLAVYLGVSVRDFPGDPESLDDPKQVLVNLARRSRRRAIREDLVPLRTSGQAVGPAYTTRMIEFIQDRNAGWRPNVAAGNCNSLHRCMQAMSELIKQPYPATSNENT